MSKRVLALLLAVPFGIGLISCGGGRAKNPPSGLQERVLASQGVTSPQTFGGLVIINGKTDTLARASLLPAGSTPGLMTLSPTRNIVAAFDATSNTVFAIDTTKETGIGNVRLPGSTTSIVIPTASATGYAAVPSATISGFNVLGAVEVMNFSSASLTTTIAVTNAQTVVAEPNGSRLLVFSGDSDSVTVLSPGSAVPPVDTSCMSAPNVTCTIVSGFNRPVYAIFSGGTAYILNCGFECQGTQPASVAVFDLASLTITSTIPVDAATIALINGNTLYVAGTSTTNNACTGQTTAATVCGRLDAIDLSSGTVTGSAVITDGYHDRMDWTVSGRLFIGSHNCTNIGNVNNASGEVRGCLSIFNSGDGSVVIPPDNGDVTGLQGFTSRNVEYVAEGGNLRVYDTTKDILLINSTLTGGSISIVGHVGDVKAIDFF